MNKKFPFKFLKGCPKGGVVYVKIKNKKT